jgi:hypothetical protein
MRHVEMLEAIPKIEGNTKSEGSRIRLSSVVTLKGKVMDH